MNFGLMLPTQNILSFLSTLDLKLLGGQIKVDTHVVEAGQMHRPRAGSELRASTGQGGRCRKQVRRLPHDQGCRLESQNLGSERKASIGWEVVAEKGGWLHTRELINQVSTRRAVEQTGWSYKSPKGENWEGAYGLGLDGMHH